MKRKDREKKLLQEFDEFKRQFADIDPELARKAIAAQKEKETRELEEKGNTSALSKVWPNSIRQKLIVCNNKLKTCNNSWEARIARSMN